MSKIVGKQILNSTITQTNMSIETSTVVSGTSVTNKEYVIQQINDKNTGLRQSTLNQNMTANVATVGQKACDIQIIEFPLSRVSVCVNGMNVSVGNGLDCYFSGETIRVGGFAQKGDYLYWNSSKFNLDTNDEIDFNYLVGYDYLTLSGGTTITLDPYYNNIIVKYSGDTGTYMNVIIDGVTFICGNSGGSFIWDSGGTYEHIFTTPNEFITIYVNEQAYTIWFDGFGSLVYSITKNGYDLLTQDYINGMVNKPTDDHSKLINTFVMKTKNIIKNKADVMYLGNINNSNDSFRNLVKNAHHGTIQGTGLTFDSYYGFSNPSGNSGVNTNYNPSTQGVKYTLNDAAITIYLIGTNLDQTPTGYPIAVGDIPNNNFTGIRKYWGYWINQDNYLTNITNLPFPNGLQLIRRTSNLITNWVNQNVTNISASKSSNGIPNNIFKLWNNNLTYPYLDGLNFTYIGASLTDAEFTILNNAVNDYLIQCLFLKYGVDNWGVKMAESYFLNLHNFDKYEAFEVYEFLKRHQSGYTYTPIEQCSNGGFTGMTDLIDTNSDGFANMWWSLNGVGSIVTGNGFIGRAQRLDVNVSINTILYIPGVTANAGVNPTQEGIYRIRFKYRNKGGFRFYGIRTDPSNNGIYKVFSENTGNTISVDFYTYSTTNVGTLRFYLDDVDTPTIGDWIEISEISITQILESDVTTFNKVTNSGFGLGTDWINPVNGLAQGWTIFPNTTCSIVDGNGFTNNAQRVQSSLSNSQPLLAFNGPLVIGRSYTIYGKYRSSQPFRIETDQGALYIQFSTNSGTCTTFCGTFTAIRINNYFRCTVNNSWFEIDEVCVIDNSNSQFYYNFFGPNGLNKTTCDYLMLFKAGGNLLSKTWSKTGTLLRWNQDGTICNSNTMPTYTRSTNLGIITITSTDGWNLVTQIDITQSNNPNCFYGNFPLISKIKDSSNKLYLLKQVNAIKTDFRTESMNTIYKGIYDSYITNPGYTKLDLNKLVGGSYPNVLIFIGSIMGTNKIISGNMSLFTNEFNAQIIISNDLNVYGTLLNLVIANSFSNISIYNTSITAGTSVWNKNIGAFNLSNNLFTTQAILDQLTIIKNQLTITPPIGNLTCNFSGASMGIVAANNQLILDIATLHVAAGFTFTCTTRTS